MLSPIDCKCFYDCVGRGVLANLKWIDPISRSGKIKALSQHGKIKTLSHTDKMPTTNALSDDYIERLQNAIRKSNHCESKYIETVTVSESFQSFQHDTNWQGDVAVFEICGHPQAQRAYAWSCAPIKEEMRYVVVLEIPPVNSPQTAVQAAIAAQIVNRTFRP